MIFLKSVIYTCQWKIMMMMMIQNLMLQILIHSYLMSNVFVL